MKLLVVDDHFMIIEGIRSMLLQEAGIEWIEYASSADSCLAFLSHKKPDIILMDINLPGMSGIELCKEVRKQYPAIGIIALSTFNESSYIRKMLENGASGYLLKNASKEEILEAMQTVQGGKQYLSFEAAIAVRRKEEEMPVITRREKEVLTMIAEGLTNPDIAGKLFVSTTTIETHRKNLLMKLQAKNTAALVKIAIINRLIDLPQDLP